MIAQNLVCRSHCRSDCMLAYVLYGRVFVRESRECRESGPETPRPTSHGLLTFQRQMTLRYHLIGSVSPALLPETQLIMQKRRHTRQRLFGRPWVRECHMPIFALSCCEVTRAMCYVAALSRSVPCFRASPSEIAPTRACSP